MTPPTRANRLNFLLRQLVQFRTWLLGGRRRGEELQIALGNFPLEAHYLLLNVFSLNLERHWLRNPLSVDPGGKPNNPLFVRLRFLGDAERSNMYVYVDIYFQ